MFFRKKVYMWKVLRFFNLLNLWASQQIIIWKYFYQSDVTGECNTNYTVVSTGWYSNTRIKKTKDLLGCTDRNGYRSSVHAMPYRISSEIQSLPLMKSTHECEQEMDKNGLLKSALIREIHTFRPFSQATSGATTKIIQRLNHKTQRSGVTTRQGIQTIWIWKLWNEGTYNCFQWFTSGDLKFYRSCHFFTHHIFYNFLF